MKTKDNKLFEEQAPAWIERLNQNDGILNENDKNSNNDFISQSEKQIDDMKQFKNIEKFDADKAWNKVFDRIKRDGIPLENTKNKQFRIKRIALSAAAAAVLITFGIVSLYLMQSKSETILAFADKACGIKTVAMPDGSEITLNIGSQIAYGNDFNKGNRTLSLKGEAFFKVAKNRDIPFIVQTANSQILVTGTQFNVRNDSARTEITVSEGHVKFSNQNSAPISLHAGDCARCENKIIEKVPASVNAATWKTGIFTITPEMHLKEVVNEINQAYGVNILLSSQSLNTLKPSPTAFENYSVETILDILCTQFGLRYTMENGHYVVMKK